MRWDGDKSWGRIVLAGVTWAQDGADVDRLAAAVVSPVRETLIVCVTKQSYVSSPLIDVEALAVELEGLADVWVIGRSSLGWGLTERLPAGLDVGGGRVRVWWPIVDLDAVNPADHRGFNIFDRQDGARVMHELVAYVRRMSRPVADRRGTRGHGRHRV